ncbi:MAG: polyribonucleotide nucleotidyltransferase, partial [Planctomycetota bacterium]
MKVRVEKRIGTETLWLETGELAKQAAGSCLVGYGETVVLCATATGPPRRGIDFFPLTCDYRERVAAAGKFPGGFLKREGRPTLKETLTARMIDRPIRPLFPSAFNDEVQVQAFVMASDRQNDGDVLAMNGASAALSVSPLPFQGPISSVRLAYIDGEFVPFPTHDQLETSDLDLIVSGSKDAILMIEGFAREMPEDLMAQAIMTAHGYIQEICDLQLEMIEQVNPEKIEVVVPEPDGLDDLLKERYYDAFREAKQTEGKQARADACGALQEKVIAELIPDPEAEDAIDPQALNKAWHDLEARIVRDLILAGTRADGRDCKQLREIVCKVDLLPRVHGSALFQRGETQALISVALGTTRDEQRVDGLVEEYTKKFMLDY